MKNTPMEGTMRIYAVFDNGAEFEWDAVKNEWIASSHADKIRRECAVNALAFLGNYYHRDDVEYAGELIGAIMGKEAGG